MRPVEANWYRDFLYNLTNTKERFDTAISQSTSGKKLNHLSDNPADMAYVLTLRSKIEQIDQFEKNIETGLGFIKSAESAVNAVQTAMYSIVSLTEQAASETTGANERAILADRIEATREEILNYANTEINGRFLFSGSATDTPPYDATNPPLNPNRPNQVTYVGNSDIMQIQADFSVTVDTNIPGDQIFGDSTIPVPPPHDIFGRIDNIIEALRNDDTTTLGNEISNMHEIINQLGEAMGSYGNKSAHLNQITGMLKTFKTSLTSKMSQLEDADMAEAISNLGREEVGLQAILQAGARINRTSLMNYLG